MEKALSMFSEDFGSFMRPHSETLAFPGKCRKGRDTGGKVCSMASLSGLWPLICQE